MSMYIDDVIAFVGLICLLSGFYLLLGLPASLILLGIILIFIGARMQPKSGREPGEERQ